MEVRGLTIQGITTDGSTLYPEPIAAVFGAVPHQVCQFYVLHEVNKVVLSAVAQECKRLAAGAPKLPRGRPSSKEADVRSARSGSSRRWVSCSPPLPVRPAAAQPVRAGDAPADFRGLPQLRTLAGLMEEVYRLFDRRCRMATALAKLEQLRTRLRRFGRLRKVLKKKLSHGVGEGAGVFGRAVAGRNMSNAVERGNPPHRKVQKTVYRVRTQRAIEGQLRHWTCCGSSTPKAGPRRRKTLHKARAA